MIDYLLDLLMIVDRCDVTPRELRNIISRNDTLIMKLKRQQLGGDIIEDVERHLSNKSQESDKNLKILREFEDNKEKREETIKIAGLMAEFVGELNKMVKSKPEYGELQKQILEIKDTLQGYIEN